MTNKKFLLGVPVMALVLGMTAVGCDNGNNSTGKADTWTNVTSLSQVNGTWKGSYTQTETQNGITVQAAAETTMTINASAGTRSGSSVITMTFSGSNIDDLWPSIKKGYEEQGCTVNDSNHSITMTQTMSSQSISLSDMNGAQINQYGTKIKLPAGEEGSSEIIFVKQ
jgi:hypothetical protein